MHQQIFAPIFIYGENSPSAWQRTWRSRCRRCWSWSRSELHKSFVWSSVFIILVVDTFRLFIEETEPQRTWKFVSSQMVRPSDVDGTLYSVGHGGWQQTCKRWLTYLLLFIYCFQHHRDKLHYYFVALLLRNMFDFSRLFQFTLWT